MAVEFKSSPLFCIVVHWLQYECQRIWHGMTWDDAVYFVCWRWRHCWCCLPGVFCCFIDGNTGQRTPARVNNMQLSTKRLPWHITKHSERNVYISRILWDIGISKEIDSSIIQKKSKSLSSHIFPVCRNKMGNEKKGQVKEFQLQEKDDPWDLPDLSVKSTPWRGALCFLFFNICLPST